MSTHAFPICVRAIILTNEILDFSYFVIIAKVTYFLHAHTNIEVDNSRIECVRWFLYIIFK